MIFLSLKKIHFTCMCVLVFAAVTAHAESIPLEADAFTDYMATKIRSEVGGAAVSVKGPLTLSVGSLQANLDRLYSFCQRSGAACEVEINNYAKTVSGVLKERNAPIDKDAVRIVIRSSDYIKHAQASLGADAAGLQLRPLVTGLMAVVVLDAPRTIRPVTDGDRKKLGLSQEQLFELGATNIRATLKPLSETAKPVAAGQIGTLPTSFYEVGRLTLHADWAELAASQNGTLLVTLPATDTVLYISESSPSAIDALKAMTKNIARKSPSPLSLEVLRWTKERWELVQ